jgi:hypothetical protein
MNEQAEGERGTIVVLYDPATGEIVHLHYYAVDPDAELPAPETLERTAYEHAARHGRKFHRDRRVSVLHVDPQNFRMGAALYKVDLEKRVLVETLKDRKVGD